MKQQIKILMFTERWNVGGIENVIMSIYNNINFENMYIDILVAQKETDIYDKQIKEKGGKLINILPQKEKSPVIRTIKNIIHLKKMIKGQKYDVIHINLVNSVGLIFAYIAKKCGIKKVIVHSHNTDIGKKNRWIKLLAHNICKKIFANVPTDYVACSEKAAEWLYDKKIIRTKRVKIIKNCIDANKYQFDKQKRDKFRNENNINENELVIGNVGRFNEQKNHKFLIEIFECIKKKNKNSKLLLVGDGELKNEIKTQVKNKNLTEDVIFCGNTTDVPKCLSAMDIFVVPSLYEGGPIVAVEAQASGLPCVLSDVINKKIKILDNVKFLSLQEDVNKWAEEILEYKGTEREDNQKKIIDAQYDISSLVKNINKLYFTVNKELISVVVPIYNIENYVEKCIKSIIEQTYSNLEIILVDDGSTDNSGKICDLYQEKDSRIKVIHKKNGGLSDARNKGIESATGKYITFIDGDDFIENNFIEILFENMIKFDAGISVCGFNDYYSTDKVKKHEQVKENYIEVLNTEESLKKMLNKKCAFMYMVWNKLYKTELFTNIKFPKGKIYEDLGTIYKIIDLAKKTVYDSRCLYNYVKREKSITQTYNFDDKELNRIELANEMANFIKNKYKKLNDIAEFFRCTQYLTVVNIMIRSNKYDKTIIKETREMIKHNLKNIIQFCNLKQKIQFIVINFSFQLYKILLKTLCLKEIVTQILKKNMLKNKAIT